MSPSENDLRRALRDGEHDRDVDAQRIIIAGERRRAQRRSRIGTGVTVGALVAVLASGGVLLSETGDGGGGGGGTAAEGGAAQRSSSAADRAGQAPAASSASGAAGRSSTASSCPTDFPRLALPGGGGTGQFGADGKLFAEPVATITVCGYGTTAGDGHKSGEVVLRGATAQTLVTSLEHATTGQPSCAATPNRSVTRQFALFPVTGAGRALRTVTIELDSGGCPNHVTNGTASRNLWRPPSGLDGVFRLLGSGAPSTPGRVNGSPVRS